MTYMKLGVPRVVMFSDGSPDEKDIEKKQI